MSPRRMSSLWLSRPPFNAQTDAPKRRPPFLLRVTAIVLSRAGSCEGEKAFSSPSSFSGDWIWWGNWEEEEGEGEDGLFPPIQPLQTSFALRRSLFLLRGTRASRRESHYSALYWSAHGTRVSKSFRSASWHARDRSISAKRGQTTAAPLASRARRSHSAASVDWPFPRSKMKRRRSVSFAFAAE